MRNNNEEQNSNQEIFTSLNSNIEESDFQKDQNIFLSLPIQNLNYKEKYFSYRKSSIDEIRYIYFDKVILYLLEKQTEKKKDYHFLFYVFFIRDYFRTYIKNHNNQKFGKYFRKFFSWCAKSKTFNIVFNTYSSL